MSCALLLTSNPVVAGWFEAVASCSGRCGMAVPAMRSRGVPPLHWVQIHDRDGRGTHARDAHATGCNSLARTGGGVCHPDTRINGTTHPSPTKRRSDEVNMLQPQTSQPNVGFTWALTKQRPSILRHSNNRKYASYRALEISPDSAASRTPHPGSATCRQSRKRHRHASNSGK